MKPVLDIAVEFLRLVAPLAGAWIETFCVCFIFAPIVVAPLAGAWIET